MYIATLFIHSWFRYILLALGVWLLVVAWKGWRSGASWSASDDKVHTAFLGVLDLQFLIGLLLYFALSPVTSAALSDMGAAMKDPTLRFFGVEHIFAMVVAVAVAHVARVRSKKKQGAARYRTIFVTQCVWLVLTLAGIPWPVLDVGRPLFRV